MNVTPIRRVLMLVGLAGLMPLAACYQHTYAVGGGAPYAPVVYDRWEHFWLGGLIGHARVDVEEVCQSGRATIESRQTFLNGLVSVLTSGIYSPTTVKVRCQSGRSRDIELSADDVALIVKDPRFLLWVGEDLPDRADDVAAAQAALPDR